LEFGGFFSKKVGISFLLPEISCGNQSMPLKQPPKPELQDVPEALIRTSKKLGGMIV
jgi:hypothetical protein